MRKCNVVSFFFLVSVLFFSCQKKADYPEPAQSEPELPYVSDVVREKPIDVQPVDPIASFRVEATEIGPDDIGNLTPDSVQVMDSTVSIEIETAELETDDIEDKVPANEKTISTEDNMPEAAESDEEAESVKAPALPVFPDEPKFSVTELTEMPYVLDYLKVFFEGKDYFFFDEPQDVKSRYIYFAAHYVPESPKNAFDQVVGFEIKDGDVIPRFIIKDGDFIDAGGNIFFPIPDYFVLHGFNFYFGGSSIHVDSHFVYTNGIGSADSFHVYWYEERETYGLMSQDDPNWMPGM